MLPITQQITSEMDVLYGLYQLAIDYTSKIHPEKEVDNVKWLDTRQRILGKTAVVAQNAAELLKDFKTINNVPANERALIEEKKNLINDTLGRMRMKEIDVMKIMSSKMKSLRGELANITQRKKAAHAYITAPRATMTVS